MTGVVFIYLSKAFYTLGHSRLLAKLRSYGFEEVEIEWFTNYLFGRTQRVKIDDQLSDPYPVNSGVPQGSILPTLFLINFNDFPNCLVHCNTIQLADDTVIIMSGNNVDIIEKILNEDLVNISGYYIENELIINLKAGKSECMLLGTSKKTKKDRNHPDLIYGNTHIFVAEAYKYLGAIIDPNLHLTQQFDKMYKQVSAELKLLNKLKQYLNEEAIKHVYNSLIRPLLTYNCLTNLYFSNTQIEKFKSLDKRTKHVVSDDFEVNSIDLIYKHELKMVKKCIDGK